MEVEDVASFTYMVGIRASHSIHEIVTNPPKVGFLPLSKLTAMSTTR